MAEWLVRETHDFVILISKTLGWEFVNKFFSTFAISKGVAIGYYTFSRKLLCSQDSSGLLLIPWFIMISSFLLSAY